MPRKNNNKNISNYHYKIDFLDDDKKISKTKYYFTLEDICKEFNTSSFSVYRMIKNQTETKKLKDMKIEKSITPIYQKVYIQND
jgi:hypothetical protein